MKSYKARKDPSLLVIAAFFLVLTAGGYLYIDDITTPFMVFILPSAILSWIYFDTSYTIQGNMLYYRSAFLRGKIDINSIHHITSGKTMWSGLKPALAKKGLILKYNKYDEIYIAPESNPEMIADLLHINQHIEISEST